MRRKASHRGKALEKEVSLEITPLIDVTFLILVFFMCTFEFKRLDKKLTNYLPDATGLRPVDVGIPKEVPEIIVKVPLEDRHLAPLERRARFLCAPSNRLFGTAHLKVGREGATELRFDPRDAVREMVSFLEQVKHIDPSVREVKLRVDPRAPHAYTAALIGYTRRARYDKVTCAGIPLDLMERLRRGDL